MSALVEQTAVGAATEGWCKVTLGEIYDIGSSKRILQKQWKDFGVPFYRAREIVKLAKQGFVDNDLFISEDHFAELEETKGVPRPGDLMVSAVGTLGACYAVQPGDRFYFKDASVLWFRPLVPIEPRFMQYAFLSDDLLEKVKSGEGATVGTFTIARAKATEFLLPPIEEQKRIVAVLDQAFTALDRVHAHAEANLADADNLTKSIVMQALDAANATHSVQTTLGELCTIARGGSPRPIKRYLTDVPDGINWIKISDATASGQYIDRTKQKISKNGVSRSRYVEPGAFLLTNSMSFGRPYILRTSGCIHDGWLVLEPDYKRVDQNYLYYLLGSSKVFNEFDRLAAGSTVRNLNIGLVSKVSITLPPLDVQRRFADAIASALARTSEANAAYRGKLAGIADLRQSLLQKAFAGELT